MVVDLDKLFHSIHPAYPYAVIKQSHTWPFYEPYSDVDILCINAEDTGYLLRLYLTLMYPGIDIRGDLTEKRGRVDVYEDDKLDIRFDLYGEPPWDGVSKGYTEDMLARSQRVEGVRVPGHLDDLAIRLWEYTQHPEKTKHLDYVRDRWDPALTETLKKWCSRPLAEYPRPVVSLFRPEDILS